MYLTHQGKKIKKIKSVNPFQNSQTQLSQTSKSTASRASRTVFMPRHDDYTGQLDTGQQHGESRGVQQGGHPISQLFPKPLWIQTNNQ